MGAAAASGAVLGAMSEGPGAGAGPKPAPKSSFVLLLLLSLLLHVVPAVPACEHEALATVLLERLLPKTRQGQGCSCMCWTDFIGGVCRALQRKAPA